MANENMHWTDYIRYSREVAQERHETSIYADAKKQHEERVGKFADRIGGNFSGNFAAQTRDYQVRGAADESAQRMNHEVNSKLQSSWKKQDKFQGLSAEFDQALDAKLTDQDKLFDLYAKKQLAKSEAYPGSVTTIELDSCKRYLDSEHGPKENRLEALNDLKATVKAGQEAFKQLSREQQNYMDVQRSNPIAQAFDAARLAYEQRHHARDDKQTKSIDSVLDANKAFKEASEKHMATRKELGVITEADIRKLPAPEQAKVYEAGKQQTEALKHLETQSANHVRQYGSQRQQLEQATKDVAAAQKGVNQYRDHGNDPVKQAAFNLHSANLDVATDRLNPGSVPKERLQAARELVSSQSSQERTQAMQGYQKTAPEQAQQPVARQEQPVQAPEKDPNVISNQQGRTVGLRTETGFRAIGKDRESISTMAEHVKESGATKVTIKGSEDFKKSASIELTARGVDVKGYHMTAEDRLAAQERKDELQAQSKQAQQQPQEQHKQPTQEAPMTDAENAYERGRQESMAKYSQKPAEQASETEQKPMSAFEARLAASHAAQDERAKAQEHLGGGGAPDIAAMREMNRNQAQEQAARQQQQKNQDQIQ